MFFRADSVSLNTPHTTEKIIFKTTKIIGTLPRIVLRGEIGPKSAQLSCGVYPALLVSRRQTFRLTAEGLGTLTTLDGQGPPKRPYD